MLSAATGLSSPNTRTWPAASPHRSSAPFWSASQASTTGSATGPPIATRWQSSSASPSSSPRGERRWISVGVSYPVVASPTLIPVGVQHPLEPLTIDEIAKTVDILRRDRNLGPRVRFVSISLHEPPKTVVLSFPAQGALEREAFAILLDRDTGHTYEAVVSLTRSVIMAWDVIPDVQPSIMLDEFMECEQACKASPEWQAAMRKRGIVDFNLCMVDPWSAGNFGLDPERGRRLSRALTWVRNRP